MSEIFSLGFLASFFVAFFCFLCVAAASFFSQRAAIFRLLKNASDEEKAHLAQIYRGIFELEDEFYEESQSANEPQNSNLDSIKKDSIEFSLNKTQNVILDSIDSNIKSNHQSASSYQNDISWQTDISSQTEPIFCQTERSEETQKQANLNKSSPNKAQNANLDSIKSSIESTAKKQEPQIPKLGFFAALAQMRKLNKASWKLGAQNFFAPLRLLALVFLVFCFIFLDKISLLNIGAFLFGLIAANIATIALTPLLQKRFYKFNNLT